jgi:hypothetical protein
MIYKMTIILSSAILSELKLDIFRRRQKNIENNNFYFTPNIGIKLYTAEIIIVTPKYVVFKFDKIKDLNLLTLFRNINNFLQSKIKYNFGEFFNKNVYSIASEYEEYFTLRCSLPAHNGRYHIKYYEDNEQKIFKLPKIGTKYGCVTLEIRNVWENNKDVGFNIEVKEIHN